MKVDYNVLLKSDDVLDISPVFDIMKDKFRKLAGKFKTLEDDNLQLKSEITTLKKELKNYVAASIGDKIINKKVLTPKKSPRKVFRSPVKKKQEMEQSRYEQDDDEEESFADVIAETFCSQIDHQEDHHNSMINCTTTSPIIRTSPIIARRKHPQKDRTTSLENDSNFINISKKKMTSTSTVLPADNKKSPRSKLTNNKMGISTNDTFVLVEEPSPSENDTAFIVSPKRFIDFCSPDLVDRETPVVDKFTKLKKTMCKPAANMMMDSPTLFSSSSDDNNLLSGNQKPINRRTSGKREVVKLDMSKTLESSKPVKRHCSKLRQLDIVKSFKKAKKTEVSEEDMFNFESADCINDSTVVNETITEQEEEESEIFRKSPRRQHDNNNKPQVSPKKHDRARITTGPKSDKMRPTVICRKDENSRDSEASSYYFRSPTEDKDNKMADDDNSPGTRRRIRKDEAGSSTKEFLSPEAVVIAAGGPSSSASSCTAASRAARIRKKLRYEESGAEEESDSLLDDLLSATQQRQRRPQPQPRLSLRPSVSQQREKNERKRGHKPRPPQPRVGKTTTGTGGGNDDSTTATSAMTSPPPPPSSGSFPYVREAVKKKSDRRRMRGWACEDCRKYYEASDLSETQLRDKIDQCSRHRNNYDPFASNTPPGFWNPDFPPTQENNRTQTSDKISSK